LNDASRHWELTWTPAVREPFRAFSAHLGGEGGGVSLSGADVYFSESSFEFTYLDTTSATFLSTVELSLIEFRPAYTPVGTKCCEVIGTECGSASACFQCWDVEADLKVGGEWDGPGMPYLTLALGSSLQNLSQETGFESFEVIDNADYCLGGTATASGQTVTRTACGTPTVPPPRDTSGIQPVFAKSCQTLPEGVRPITLFEVARADTEAHARQRLVKIRDEQAQQAWLDEHPEYAHRGISCTLGARSAASSGFGWTLISLLGSLAWRRRQRPANADVGRAN
jgi:hypothetical protein